MIKVIIGKGRMTEPHELSQDDFQDVLEMTMKMESFFNEISSENDKNLAMSALMSSSINCMFAQCKSMNEIFFHRQLFIQMMDSTIKTIQIIGPSFPDSL